MSNYNIQVRLKSIDYCDQLSPECDQLSPEKVSMEESGLSKREWNELMNAFELSLQIKLKQ